MTLHPRWGHAALANANALDSWSYIITFAYANSQTELKAMDEEQQKPGIINAIDDPLKRIHSVGTRLNPEENAELETLASMRHVTPGELLRTLVKEETHRLSQTQEPSLELIEIVGLRLMLTNFLRPLAQGKTQTKEEADALSVTIRERKRTVAQEICDGVKE
jgi:hypothetical protein